VSVSAPQEFVEENLDSWGKYELSQYEEALKAVSGRLSIRATDVWLFVPFHYVRACVRTIF